MSLHKPIDLYFPTLEGNVKTSGGAINLPKGTFCIVDLDAKNTRQGAKIVSDFQGKSTTNKFEFRLGNVPLDPTRSITNKSWAGLPFTLADVKAIKVDAPDTKLFPVDEFVIGYDGENPETALDFNEGDNEIFQLCLYGKAVSYLGYKGGKHTVQFQIEAPYEGTKSEDAVPAANTWTNQELVEDAVRRLKSDVTLGQNKLTDLVEITVVNSNYPETLPGVAESFWELTLQDNGTYSDLAKVQVKYPDLDIKVKEIMGDMTTYVTTAAADPGTYSRGLADILKGCDTCPAGYTEVADGIVYSLSIEDDGADDSAAIEAAIPGVEVGSVSRNAGEQGTGRGFYSFITDNELTEAEIATFVDANPTAVIELVSNDIESLCTNPTTIDSSWVEGESCNRDTETWTIRLRDDKCGNSRLAELQAAYPELTITEVGGTDNGCMRTYSTTVTTNLVCEECDNIYRDVFVSEAPEAYDKVSWRKADKTYDGTALMGIKFKVKRNILSGDEEYRDHMNFIAESVRMKLVGGFPSEINESYNIGNNGRYNVTLLSKYEPPQNYGGNLRHYEDMARIHFEGRPRHKGNNYAKWTFGEETVFEGTKQYVDYVVRIHTRSYSNSFSQKVDEGRDYHIFAEVGRHQAIEDLLNNLASAAGLPKVQAYATA